MAIYRVYLEIIGDACIEVKAENEKEAVRLAKMEADNWFDFGPRTVRNIEKIEEDGE